MARLDEVLARDGAACLWCGHEPWRRDATLEHLLPRSRGGRTQPENLALACRRCNRARRSKGAVAYARERIAAGAGADVAALRRALERLAASPRRAHREEGRRQLRHLAGVQAPPPAGSAVVQAFPPAGSAGVQALPPAGSAGAGRRPPAGE